MDDGKVVDNLERETEREAKDSSRFMDLIRSAG